MKFLVVMGYLSHHSAMALHLYFRDPLSSPDSGMTTKNLLLKITIRGIGRRMKKGEDLEEDISTTLSLHVSQTPTTIWRSRAVCTRAPNVAKFGVLGRSSCQFSNI